MTFIYKSGRSARGLFPSPLCGREPDNPLSMSENRDDLQASSFERSLSRLNDDIGVSKLSTTSFSTAGPLSTAAPSTIAPPAISTSSGPCQRCRRGRFRRWLSGLLYIPDESVQAQIQELQTQIQRLVQQSQDQTRRHQDRADQLTLYARQCQLERKLCHTERMECQEARHQIETERKRCQDTRRQLLLETKKAERLNKETEARHNELDNLMQVEQAEPSNLEGHPEATLSGLGRNSGEHWS